MMEIQLGCAYEIEQPEQSLAPVPADEISSQNVPIQIRWINEMNIQKTPASLETGIWHHMIENQIRNFLKSKVQNPQDEKNTVNHIWYKIHRISQKNKHRKNNKSKH